MKVRDVAEAIEKANDSRLGLAGSVWTRDKDKANAVARQMNTGTVNINNVITGLLQFGVPMAGWKESGLGSHSGGADGIRKYCRQKAIVADRVAMKRSCSGTPTAARRATS
jgi:acyl-CoA reductase-like NAD-dependent aldehyde dehydrogenase